MLTEFSHEQNKTSLGLHFLATYWYVVLIFIGLIVIMVWLYNRLKSRLTFTGSKKIYYIKALAAFIAAIILTVGGIRGDFKHSTRPITISNAGEYVKRPQEIYLVLNTPFVFIRTIFNTDLQVEHYFSDEEVEKIYTPFHYQPPADSLHQPFTKTNVIVIILESFGKEALGGYNKDLDSGRYKGYTPFLDSLMTVSKVYWNSFANGHKSIDAIPSLLASIPNGPNSFVLTPYSSDSIRSLPRLLKDEGYSTSFFHGAPNGSMGFLALTKLLGIDNYYGKTEYNNDADYDGVWGIWDEPFFQFFEQKLNTFKEPFFSSIFSVSSHDPFKVPKQYIGKFKKGPLPVWECISYTDMALRKFFAKASQQPWFKNTLFVISADHATVSYYPEYKNAKGYVSIPILLYSGGDSTLRGVDTSIIQQIDVMPSVLSYLHYDKPFTAFGENVFSKQRLNFAYNYSGEYCWFQNNYLLFFNGDKSNGLFNYHSDKLMAKDSLEALPGVAADMERNVKAFIQQYNNRLIENKLTVNK